MRIVHFVPAFSVLTETFIYDLIFEMERQGVDSQVVTMSRLNEGDRSYEKVRMLRRIRTSPGRVLLHAAALFSPAKAIGFDALGLGKVLAELRPDVVWAHFGGAGLQAAGACRALGIPLIVGFQGHDIYTAGPRRRERYRALFQVASSIIAASQDMENALSLSGAIGDKTHVLHNGISIGDFPYGDPAIRFDGRKVRCLQVGRLVPKKDPIGMVKAFAIAAKSLPSLDLSLTIVGDGPLRADLTRCVRTLGLERRVCLLGAVPRSRVAALMGEAHIYTQPGRTGPDGDREGLGVSITEASCSGLPVISTRHGGISEIVRDRVSGCLVPEGDEAALARCLKVVALQPELWTRYGAAGRQHVEENFDLSIQARRAVGLARRVALGRR